MYQPPWIRFLGFSTPPPSMGLSPLNLRQEMGHLHTFHDVLLAFQKKNGAALHIRRPWWNNQGHSRFVCFFLGGKWMNYIYSSHSDWKNWGPALCCASFGSPQKKTHVDLINEYQSPKTCSHVSTWFNILWLNKVCFKVFCWCAYLVIVVVVKPIVPQHGYSWGKNPILRATHPVFAAFLLATYDLFG